MRPRSGRPAPWACRRMFRMAARSPARPGIVTICASGIPSGGLFFHPGLVKNARACSDALDASAQGTSQLVCMAWRAGAGTGSVRRKRGRLAAEGLVPKSRRQLLTVLLEPFEMLTFELLCGQRTNFGRVRCSAALPAPPTPSAHHRNRAHRHPTLPLVVFHHGIVARRVCHRGRFDR